MSTYSELLKKYSIDPILLKHVWLGEKYYFYKIQYSKEPQFILVDFEGSKGAYSSKYERNIGNDFSTFVDDRHMKRLHRFYSYYKEYRGDFEFISTEDGVDYWLYYAKIMEEFIIIKKVRIFQQFLDKEFIDKEEKNHIKNDYSMYLMIEDGGKHKVLRCNESLVRDFSIECEVSELRVYELVELLTQDVFKENLNEAQTFNVEHRIKIGEVEMSLLLEIIPQKRAGKTFIFIKGYKMDESRNAGDLLSYSMQYKRLFHSSYYGICNVEIENGKRKGVSLINEYLRTIIQLNYKTYGEFFELPILQDVIMQRVMQYQTITLRENKEKQKQFILCAFPVLLNGMITTIHICLFQEEKKRGVELLTLLTKRESEILSLASKGLTNRYIAERLSVTEGTVKKTIYRGYKKLNITTKLELVELFREMDENVEFR